MKKIMRLLYVVLCLMVVGCWDIWPQGCDVPNTIDADIIDAGEDASVDSGVLEHCLNRAPITSLCLCGEKKVVHGYCCYKSVNSADIVHQQEECGYTEYSPHWGHILIAKEDYRYPPDDVKLEEQRWNAKHFDLVIRDWDRSSIMKQVNPTILNYIYKLDQTICHGLDDEIYSRLVQFAGTQDLESAFLHFAEDTVIRTPEGDISILGCEQPTKECRTQGFEWSTFRWHYNPRSELAINFLIQYWNEILTTIIPMSDDYVYDGIFLDEHPWLPGRSLILSGGKILEYNATWNDETFKQAYQSDLVEYISRLQAALPADKRLLINAAEYSTKPAAIEQFFASKGGFFEFMLDPNRSRFGMEAIWTTTQALISQNINVVLVTRVKYGDQIDYYPDGYTAGNYSTPGQRARLVELAMYYMAKDKQNKQVYFDILGGWWWPYTEIWTKAVEVNVGHPLEEYYVYAQGVDSLGSHYTIFARNFSNALILFRPKDVWDYSEFGDETMVHVPLDIEMTPIDAEGNMMPSVSFVNLRNSEAVILLQ